MLIFYKIIKFISSVIKLKIHCNINIPKMDSEDIEIKVTLIGDSSVGKTCIINKYTKDKFDNEELSTTGANYSQKLIVKNGKTIRLDLWDTAGQEAYRAIGRHFYKESYIVCLVYDITNEGSFENLKEVWYKELLEYGEEVKIVAIVGNKADLYLEEKVKEEEGRNFAKEKNAIFALTSAKTGDGIEELFGDLLKKYFEEKFPELLEEAKKEKKADKNIKINDVKVEDNKVKKKIC